ncbi:OTU domain-containing protein 6B [Mortierella sp. GBA43]|nr:OTU domain-containing protein 6B [Mortierella sp. GBA43]
MDKDSHAQHPQEDQPAAAHETLEELRTRHKKEKRELTAKVTALKKIAKNDKKKKKEVTEEIAQLEHAQNVQHDKEEKEWKSLYGTSTPAENHIPDSTSTSSAPSQEPQEDEEDDFDIPIDHLIIEPTPAKQQQQQQAPGGKKPNRQRARKDRKAQAIKEIQDQAQKEASGKVNMNEVERKAIEELAQAMSVSIQDITADGHCLYNAISDQLVQHYNVEASVKELRRDTAEHMRSNPDDFMPFLTNKQGDIMSPEDFAEYCQDLESTAVWGGQPELLALSRVHKVPIWVVQMGSPTVKLSSDAYPTKTPLKVSYHRHMYGLGEHYNSLRPKQASV